MVRNLCSFMCFGLGVVFLCLGMMGQTLKADPGTGEPPPPVCTGCTACLSINPNDAGSEGVCGGAAVNIGKCKTPVFGSNCSEAICGCIEDGLENGNANVMKCKCKI